MASSTWEEQREAARPYKYSTRNPTETGLYRIVYHNREELPRVWEERFQPDYGVLRDEVLETFDAYLNCGILAHGFATAVCENQECEHTTLIAFSCKKRICPSCAAKRAIIFAETLEHEILAPVDNRHIVWSIPKRLRPYFKFDRKNIQILFAAAWESLLLMFESALPNKGVPGAAFAIQTNGDSLNFNPHLHAFVSDGTFDSSNTFHKLGFIDCEKLTLLFAHKVLAAMLKKNLIPQVVVDSILMQQHTGFNVWAGDIINPADQNARLFIARYIDRGPISNSNIFIDGDIVTYLTKDGLTHEFDPLEFLARISPHVAKKWEQTVRYFGYYSSKSRGLRKKAELAALPPLSLGAEEPPPKKAVSRKWRELIKKVYEIDPLLCPKCGACLKIKKLYGPDDQTDIKQILAKLGIQAFKSPPPITSPPAGVTTEPSFDDLPSTDDDF